MKNNKKKYALVIILILFIAFFSSQCMMRRTNTESKKTVAVILPYTYNKENSRILDAIRDYAHNNSIILDVWHEKSLSSNELSSIIANEEQNHAIGILLIYPENYLTQQEKHYDYNNVLAITATMQTAFSHYAAFENSPFFKLSSSCFCTGNKENPRRQNRLHLHKKHIRTWL